MPVVVQTLTDNEIHLTGTFVQVLCNSEVAAINTIRHCHCALLKHCYASKVHNTSKPNSPESLEMHNNVQGFWAC